MSVIPVGLEIFAQLEYIETKKYTLRRWWVCPM